MIQSKEQHFVLVHGMCQGAWCWYKLKPLLESGGHKVTPLDMSASGINTLPIERLKTFREYNQPLLSFLASLPQHDKVVLVGHSLGGLNIAFAMEEFPDKIAAAVFLAAFMPDTLHNASYFYEILFKKKTAEGGWLDTRFNNHGSPDEPFIVAHLGHKFLSDMCYQLSPIEDLELAKLLSRPLPDFTTDLAKAGKLSEGGYGSVRRAYVICKEDKAIPHEYQREMVGTNTGDRLKHVKVIEGADHMAMLCKPQQLCACLIDIAEQL